MALRQTQNFKLLQKLSPQQIQLMKLLQLPTVALEQRIKEELELNPALEEDTLSEVDEIENEYDEVDSSEIVEDNDFEEKVKGICTPLNVSGKNHVWDIKIYNDADELTCVSRFTCTIIPKNKFKL